MYYLDFLRIENVSQHIILTKRLLRMKNHPIIQYIKQTAKHAVNLFSIFSLFLALVIPFLPLSDALKLIGTSLLAVIAVLGAGYFAWREAIDQLPKAADLSIKCDNFIFGPTSSSRGVPHSPMRFSIILDAINQGEESAILRSLEVTKFIMKNEVLGSTPLKPELNLRNFPHANRQIHFPYTIEGRQRLPNLEYQVFVELKVQEPLEFAKRLNELDMYEIELSYTFDDMERLSHTRTILINGSFEDYKKGCIKEWSRTQNQHELALAALETMGVI